ncbi:MAG: DUF2726 domain-containing protein [Endozoicomonas sp.]
MSLESSLLIPAASALAFILLVVIIGWRFRPMTLGCRSPLFTHEYRSFLGQLDIAVRSHLTIFPRMSVAEVLEGTGAGKSLLSKSSRLRFDFVVCHRREMEVLCVIQLSPASGSRPETEKLRKICEKADLTLLEYDVKPYRDVPSLRKAVFGACGIDEFELPPEAPVTEQETEENTDTAEETGQPDCPKCGAAMKRRTLKKGKHAGQECWVCNRYPDCRGARLDGHSG